VSSNISILPLISLFASGTLWRSIVLKMWSQGGNLGSALFVVQEDSGHRYGGGELWKGGVGRDARIVICTRFILRACK
jgi:hypothetical protein